MKKQWECVEQWICKQENFFGMMYIKGTSTPPLEQDIKCDVLIIGSGATGAHCAFRLAEAGLSVALVDKRKVGEGSTLSNTGLLQYSNDEMLSSLIRTFGAEKAVRHYKLCLSALKELKEEILPFLEDDPEFRTRKSLYFASSFRDVHSLKEEYEALSRYGFPAEFLTKQEISRLFPIAKEAAIVTGNDGEINPFKYVHLLLRYAFEKGVKIYGQTEIVGRKHTKDGILFLTESGRKIKANKAIFATGYEPQKEVRDPNENIVSSYAIVTNRLDEMDLLPERMMFWETARPYLYGRTTVDGRFILGGLDEYTVSKDKRDKLLEGKRKGLLKELITLFPHLEHKVRTEFYWGAFFGETYDGLPSIAIYDDVPNCFFLRSFGGNGTVYSIIFSGILRKVLTEGNDPDLGLYLKNRQLREDIKNVEAEWAVD